MIKILNEIEFWNILNPDSQVEYLAAIGIDFGPICSNNITHIYYTYIDYLSRPFETSMVSEFTGFEKKNFTLRGDIEYLSSDTHRFTFGLESLKYYDSSNDRRYEFPCPQTFADFLHCCNMAKVELRKETK